MIQICPRQIAGHLVNGMKDGKPHIIAEGILSEVLSKKGNIYKVKNHGEDQASYLIESEGVYSHGATLKEARESLIYKKEPRDTSAYKDFTLETIVTKEEAIEMYRAITGTCSEGTRYFVEKQKIKKAKFTVSEIIELTKGQYNSVVFDNFFNKK